MTYATVSDVAARLGRPITTEAETAQVDAWLTDVEVIIRSRIPDLDERIGDGRLAEGVVVMVEAAAVVRKVLNPEGLRQVAHTRSLDDWSETTSETRDRLVSDGFLGLTDDEWALLLATSTGAWTINPYTRWERGYWARPDLWVPLS
jgi:hypothetical protein